MVFGWSQLLTGLEGTGPVATTWAILLREMCASVVVVLWCLSTTVSQGFIGWGDDDYPWLVECMNGMELLPTICDVIV